MDVKYLSQPVAAFHVKNAFNLYSLVNLNLEKIKTKKDKNQTHDDSICITKPANGTLINPTSIIKN